MEMEMEKLFYHAGPLPVEQMFIGSGNKPDM